jgi:phosphohistidine phosphatase SixA
MKTEQQRSTRQILIGVLLGVAVSWLVMALSRHEAVSRTSEGTEPVSEPVLNADPARSTDASKKAFDVSERIRAGGYILYFRHGNRQKWDSVIAFDVYELATQTDSEKSSFKDAVCLSPQGREEALMIGKILALSGTKVDSVAASPSCRAQQTALLAMGHIDMSSVGLAHTPVTNISNAGAFTLELGRVLGSVRLSAGHNAVVFAHGNTLENSPELFASGHELLSRHDIQETGIYVIERHQDRTLHLVHKFLNLGEFAAAAITLDPTSAPPKLPATQ